MLSVCILDHELYRYREEAQRLLSACRSSARAAGYKLVKSPKDGQRVVLWGLGSKDIADAAKPALKRGGHIVSWDLGYFRRSGPEQFRGYRVSMDGFHPDRLVMARDRSPERWEELNIPLRNDWDPDGPILLVGMGRKSVAMYSEAIGDWETATAAKIAAKIPDRKIWFRPKPGDDRHCQSVAGTYKKGAGSIAEALKGKSLVVCRHSNVGIDALIAGVPAVTFGGAASCVLPDTIEFHEPVKDEIRLRFLRNVAWFEWSIGQVRRRTFWEFAEELIADVERLT